MKHPSVIFIGVLFGIVAYWIGSEIYWDCHISPGDSRTLDEFQKRFKDGLRISGLTRNGHSYKIASGPMPPFYVLSFPSSPPIYIFEDSGTLVDWAADAGDQNQDSSFNVKWIKPE